LFVFGKKEMAQDKKSFEKRSNFWRKNGQTKNKKSIVEKYPALKIVD